MLGWVDVSVVTNCSFVVHVCRWLLLLDCLLAVGVNLCILAFLRYLSALLLLFAAYFKVSHVPSVLTFV